MEVQEVTPLQRTAATSFEVGGRQAAEELAEDTAEVNRTDDGIQLSRQIWPVVACLAVVLTFFMAYYYWRPEGNKKEKPPPPFDEKLATELATMSAVAYCRTSTIETWSCGELCNTMPEMQGPDVTVASCPDKRDKFSSEKAQSMFLTKWKGEITLVFRGSSKQRFRPNRSTFIEETELVEFSGCEHCRVNRLINERWHSVKDCVQKKLKFGMGAKPGTKLRVTGHDIGAAVAQLATISLIQDGYTIDRAYVFGSPRVGDSEFSKVFAQKVGGQFSRVSNGYDPEVHLPPREPTDDRLYVHAGSEVYFPPVGKNKDGNKKAPPYVFCAKPEDIRCASKEAVQLQNYNHVEDHLHYMGVLLSKSLCPDQDTRIPVRAPSRS